MSLWRGEALILASKSKVRKKILEAAGIPVAAERSNIDERAIESSKAKAARAAVVALVLAREKALEVAQRNLGRVVLGADQTLALGDRRFSKPPTPGAAREQLTALAGKTHDLHSAIAIVQEGAVAFEMVVTAHLTMRPLSREFIDVYLATAGERVSSSVGAYQLEGLGVHLFERVEGDHFSILGIPLIPLLSYFRSTGQLIS